ncbi:MAG TPA: SDR family oxidoreductase [Balneolales bacterium]|nr:SDR family oxidoreductase [Balneolales bacterium]
MRSLQDLLNLKGKTAFISGGAGYLGSAMCETLAELGANLVIASRDLKKCENYAQSLTKRYGNNNIGLKADITNIKEVKQAYEDTISAFGSIDILINNAWSGNKNTFESISYEDWHYDVNICLNAVFYSVKEAFPYLMKSKGIILNIGSMYGHIAPDYRIYDGEQFANPPSYGAAKAAVLQLTQYLASFLSPHGIRVNAISPGPFPFPETQKHEEFMERLSSKNMMNRIGEPDDLKGAVALLCSDASKYMTGQNICVDGGWSKW